MVNPFVGEKSTIINETKVFNEGAPNVSKCISIATKVLYLQIQGINLTPTENSDLFFRTTKLFQCNNEKLRRMVYLLLKKFEVSETEAFMATSCLTGDMNTRSELLRANALRTLGYILDAGTVMQFERYIKAAMVEKSTHVSAAAIACSIKLFQSNQDIVKRWVKDINELLLHREGTTQTLALFLMNLIKKNDPLSLHKMAVQLAKMNIRSPISQVAVVRTVGEVLLSSYEKDGHMDPQLLDYIDSCVRQKHSEHAQLEAAKLLVSFAELDKSNETVSSAFGIPFTNLTSALQAMLSSSRPTVRYAGMRLLSRLSSCRPSYATMFNSRLETALGERSRAVSSLAFMVLLRTSSETGVERLVKYVDEFYRDETANAKTEIVSALRKLCVSYPAKAKLILSFFSGTLRDEGTFNFKVVVARSIFDVCESVADCLEIGLLSLCEYIEDCEHPNLCSQILTYISHHAASCKSPGKFVRFIYNRILLEDAVVRAAAVDALARMASDTPRLKDEIRILLRGCLYDRDDEVRTRATQYLNEEKGREEKVEKEKTEEKGSGLSLTVLYEYLVARPSVLNLENLPKEKDREEQVEKEKKELREEKKEKKEERVVSLSSKEEIVKMVEKIGKGNILGEFISTGNSLELTEAEAEYRVSGTNYVFEKGIICEFQVTNTLEEGVLREIWVDLKEVRTSDWKVCGVSKVPVLDTGAKDVCYVVLEKRDGRGEIGVGTFAAVLKFAFSEGMDEEGYLDDFVLENHKIGVKDYLGRKKLTEDEFKGVWEKEESDKGKYVETVSSFSLSTCKNLVMAVELVTGKMNMNVCNDTIKDLDTNTSRYVLLLAGSTHQGDIVLSKVLLGMHPKLGCILKISTRSHSEAINKAVISLIE